MFGGIVSSGNPFCASSGRLLRVIAEGDIPTSIPLGRRPLRELEGRSSRTASTWSKFYPPLQRYLLGRLVHASGCSDVAFPCASYTRPALRVPEVDLLSARVPTGFRCPLPVRCATDLVADVEVGSRRLLPPSGAASAGKAERLQFVNFRLATMLYICAGK